MEILIVDDSRVITDIFEQFLDRRGYQVHCARSGKEAISIIEKNHSIQLVLMDLHMPGINGREAGMAIKKQLPKIPIFAISARHKDDVWPDLQDAGFDGYLEKPVKLTEIEGLLQQYQGSNKAI